MGLFDNKRPAPAPAQQEAKYSVAKIEALLDAFGPLRLRVRDPSLKVLITKVTWGAIPHLMNTTGGKPDGGQMSAMMTTITMLTDTMNVYIRIQDNPESAGSPDEVATLMQRGYQAVANYWNQLSPAGSQRIDHGNYIALTDYLGGTGSSS